MSDESAAGRRALDALSIRGLAGKRDYVRSLEQRRDPEAMSLLVECLCDESSYVRDLAETALLEMGERGASAVVPLLRQGLWFSRASAARLLGRLGHAPAAAGLLGLTDDSVEAVVREAYAALATLAQRGGAARVAWELHRSAPERRLDRLARLQQLDRPAADRIERLLRIESLMTQADPDVLRDDAPLVRETEEGVAWEPLSPPPTRPVTPPTPGGAGPSSR